MWHLGNLDQDLFVLVVAPWYPKSLFSAVDLVWNTSAETVEKLPCTVCTWRKYTLCMITFRVYPVIATTPGEELHYPLYPWNIHHPNGWNTTPKLHRHATVCIVLRMENGRLVNILWACFEHHIVLSIGSTPLHNAWCACACACAMHQADGDLSGII